MSQNVFVKNEDRKSELFNVGCPGWLSVVSGHLLVSEPLCNGPILQSLLLL